MLFLFALLLAALFVNKTFFHAAPTLWIVMPLLLAIGMGSMRYLESERPVLVLWQWLGAFCALYSIANYPLLPVLDKGGAVLYYGLVLFMWAGALFCGALCFYIPSLSLLPPCYLVWTAKTAVKITGLHYTTDLDIFPLAEVTMCIGLGLAINHLYGHWSKKLGLKLRTTAPRVDFARFLLLAAIGVHLANYFWSAVAKMTLDGPWFNWVLANNPAYIFLSALDDGHLFFGWDDPLTAVVFRFMDHMRLWSNAWVLAIQGLALVGLLMPRWGLLLLLLMFDAMHLSIFIFVGAGFWPWIMLNIIITVAVADHHFFFPKWTLRLLASAFIVVAPVFVQVATLGWYDTGAQNKIYWIAVSDDGTKTPVPSNFFTYYSHPFAQMDYGTPEPETAFYTGAPNGGAWQERVFKAGRACDVAGLKPPARFKRWFPIDRMAIYIRNYHALMLSLEKTLGSFPYNVYPHHFYQPEYETAAFDALDKKRIVSYIYHRESVCVTFDDKGPHREVKATAEVEVKLKP